MRYCPTCLEEYEDSTGTCDDCKQGLVTEEELAKRPGFHRVGEEDPRDFVVIGPAEDPFEADAFTAAIDDAGIAVMARMRHAGSVDSITESVSHSWWDILVPADQREKAAEVMAKRKEELAASSDDAERAAEEEERQGEEEAAAKKA
jgi:hypothetical protein